MTQQVTYWEWSLKPNSYLKYEYMYISYIKSYVNMQTSHVYYVTVVHSYPKPYKTKIKEYSIRNCYGIIIILVHVTSRNVRMLLDGYKNLQPRLGRHKYNRSCNQCTARPSSGLEPLTRPNTSCNWGVLKYTTSFLTNVSLSLDLKSCMDWCIHTIPHI